MLVLDGNMKNRRDVCLARDAGYVEYEGLPGRIKTGCMNTPEKSSRHCVSHAVRACIQSTQQSDDEEAPEIQPVKNDRIVELVLEKKVTRKCTYYKVLYITYHVKCSTGF